MTEISEVDRKMLRELRLETEKWFAEMETKYPFLRK